MAKALAKALAKAGAKAKAKAKAVAKKGAKLGQAPALAETDWLKWVGFVRKHHSTAIALVIQMTGAFALRCVEALQLKAEDFNLEASPPYLDVPGRPGAGKSPGQVPIHPHWVKEIQALKKAGASAVMRPRGNQHVEWEQQDAWQWPADDTGYLFPSRRADRAGSALGYEAVWKAVDRLAPRFDAEHPGNEFARIRTHSGRATAITAMLGQGVTVPVGMKFARHAPQSVGTFLGYGRLTQRQVHDALAGVPALGQGSARPEPEPKRRRATPDTNNKEEPWARMVQNPFAGHE
jgi:integrase